MSLCQFSIKDLIGICKMDDQSFDSTMIKRGFQSIQKNQPENIESLKYINIKESSKFARCLNNEQISMVKLTKKKRCSYKTYRDVHLKAIKELKILGFKKDENKINQVPTTDWQIETYYRGNKIREEINIMIRLGAKKLSENEIHLIYSN